MISINLYEIVMQMVNFLILLYLLNKFLIRPLSEFMEKRARDIKENIEAADSNRLDSEKLLNEQKELLKDARVEAKAIREKAEEVSKKEREEIVIAAKKESQHIVETAKKEVELSMSKAKKELLSEIGGLAVTLSEMILKRKIEAKDKDEIVSEGMKKLSLS